MAAACATVAERRRRCHRQAAMRPARPKRGARREINGNNNVSVIGMPLAIIDKPFMVAIYKAGPDKRIIC